MAASKTELLAAVHSEITLETRYQKAVRALQIIQRAERQGHQMGRPELRRFAADTLRELEVKPVPINLPGISRADS